jgi:uncharacterized RDD family membrane protein YckC
MEPAWKQEVSRRIAAHKSRKGSPAPQSQAQPQEVGKSRAAQAAARVAARYAEAPSYSQMQAEEARVAVRHAEIATRVALDAQAAAESALAELHAAATEPPSRGPAVVESITRAQRVEASPEPAFDFPPEPALLQATAEHVMEPVAEPMQQVVFDPAPETQPVVSRELVAGQAFGIRWEPDIPVRVFDQRPARVDEGFDLSAEDWWTPAQVSATLRSEPIEIEPQTDHANLIEFPRELVATRKMRPRLAEPVAVSIAQGQLSIFEVDPCTVSIDPAAADRSDAASEWSGPEWSGIELDEHPQTQYAAQPEISDAAQTIFLASLGRRLMAMVVDGSLVLTVFFASAMMIASHMQMAPAIRTAEAMGLFGLVLAGFLYYGFFFALGTSTPGMRYAGIALSTFDDESPTRAQLRRRLGAMALSLVPVGLGFAWSVFDEDHLTWHDRISQTYLRKR